MFERVCQRQTLDSSLSLNLFCSRNAINYPFPPSSFLDSDQLTERERETRALDLWTKCRVFQAKKGWADSEREIEGREGEIEGRETKDVDQRHVARF